VKQLISLFIWLVLCCNMQAQIIGQAVYPEHVNFILDCKPESQEAFTYVSKKWTFNPPNVSAIQLPDSSLVVTAAPGKYTATCKLIVGEKTDNGVLIKDPEKDIVEFKHVFTILESGKPTPPDDGDDDDTKPPTPPDDDEDKPTPPPVTVEGAWVILVEQTEERGQHVDWLLVQQNTVLWDSILQRGMKWRWYDYDSNDALMYRKDADKAGLPALLIYDKSGNLLGKEDGDNIKNKEQFNELIKRSTGK